MARTTKATVAPATEAPASTEVAKSDEVIVPTAVLPAPLDVILSENITVNADAVATFRTDDAALTAKTDALVTDWADLSRRTAGMAVDIAQITYVAREVRGDKFVGKDWAAKFNVSPGLVTRWSRLGRVIVHHGVDPTGILYYALTAKGAVERKEVAKAIEDGDLAAITATVGAVVNIATDDRREVKRIVKREAKPNDGTKSDSGTESDKREVTVSDAVNIMKVLCAMVPDMSDDMITDLDALWLEATGERRAA